MLSFEYEKFGEFCPKFYMSSVIKRENFDSRSTWAQHFFVSKQPITKIQINSKIICLQSPSILVPRPRRLRDEKRAMGTRMKPELDQFRTHTLYFLTTGKSERSQGGMNGNLFRPKTEQEKELNDTDKI